MASKQSDSEWRDKLTPDQYHVLREGGTETPGSGVLLYNNETGDYRCAACGNLLFHSNTKYESTIPGLIGWPSFSAAAKDGAVILSDDFSLGMKRREVTCTSCGSHLGHLFPDKTSDTGQHYCINSAALDFQKK
jgi:peptide-methionine (R)-S-oxide reductase